MSRSKKLSEKQNKFVRDVLTEKIYNLMDYENFSVTGACKELAKELGLSFATLYNIYRGRLCSEKTAHLMIKNGWFSSEDISFKSKQKKYKSNTSTSDKRHTKTHRKTYDQKAYNKGCNKAYNSGFFDGYDVGMSDGYLKGVKKSQKQKYHYTSSLKNSPHYVKLKKLLSLRSGTSYKNEANNAGKAASNLLNKMLADHPDFKDLNVNVNVE